MLFRYMCNMPQSDQSSVFEDQDCNGRRRDRAAAFLRAVNNRQRAKTTYVKVLERNQD